MSELFAAVDLSDPFWQYLLIGLVTGSLYALIALGYTMVYGIIELINFAHGDLFMLGSFLALTVLTALGADAVEAVQSMAASAPSDEAAFRAEAILRKLNATGKPVGAGGKTVRAVRILERAGTAEAKALLAKAAEGECGFDVSQDAKAALARMKAKP